jgi:hypothetical protein
MSRWHWAAVTLVALLAGCVRPAPQRSGIRLALPSSTAPASLSSKPSATQGAPATNPTKQPDAGEPTVTPNGEAGTISGRLLWEGAADTALAGQESPRLRINAADKGIAGGVIWLVKAPAGTAPLQALELQLYQQDRQFRPHVLAAPRGSSLKMLTTDEKASFKATGAADFTCSPQKGKPQVRTLDRAGLVELRSEVDPAMSGYLWVFDHPCFAVTDGEGRFRLPEVPPGRYEVVMWHEGWRSLDPAQHTYRAPVQKKATMELGKGQGAAIQFTLGNRDAEK